jgi:hypothetical protein
VRDVPKRGVEAKGRSECREVGESVSTKMGDGEVRAELAHIEAD